MSDSDESSKSSIWTDILVIATLVVFCLAAGITLTWVTCNRQWRREAVEKGHAEYYLNENHIRQWRWIEEKNDE